MSRPRNCPPSRFARTSLDSSAAAPVAWTRAPVIDPIAGLHRPLATAFPAAPREQYGFAVDRRFQSDGADSAAESALWRQGEPHQVFGHGDLRIVAPFEDRGGRRS